MARSIWQTSILPLLGILPLVGLSRGTGPIDLERIINRRGLIKLSGLGLTTLLTGAWRSRSLSSASRLNRASTAVRCVLTPEQTEGPYYISQEKVRRTISEHKPGTPLKLRLAVVDASTCKPIRGAAVDIWHCDAGGVYSGFEAASAGGPPGGGAGPTDKHTFLRGIQFTDAQGRVEFDTLYPGWYRGRTVHIHVKVHLNHSVVGQVVHTGQLYFSDTLTHTVYQSRPYSARAAARDTFNNADGIYQNGGRQSMLTMKRDGRGFIGSIILGVRRA